MNILSQMLVEKIFNAKGDGLLTPTTDDIKNYVYKVNSFRTFETTVYEDDLRMAFLTETGVYSMVTAKNGCFILAN